MTRDSFEVSRQHKRAHDAYRARDVNALREALNDPRDFPNCHQPLELAVGDHPLEYAIYWSSLAFIELLIELGRKADVLVENFVPSVMPRLGLSADVFLEANPRLIYASASGFGSTGPYADKLALDLTIQAMGGLMSTTGELGSRPLKAHTRVD